MKNTNNDLNFKFDHNIICEFILTLKMLTVEHKFVMFVRLKQYIWVWHPLNTNLIIF